MRETDFPGGVLIEPVNPVAALVVISGSSGRLELERARALAAHDIAAYAFQWYQGMPAPLDDYPLDTFEPVLDRVRSLAPRTGILGSSFGAEISLILAAHGVSLDLVVALAPTSVVWQSPLRDARGRPVGVNKWSWRGRSVVGVPYIDAATWPDFTSAPALDVHVASLATFAGEREDVVIQVERITADLVVSSGGADAVWQAERFCEDIVQRRAQVGLPTVHVHHPRAGHRPVLPGEVAPMSPHSLPHGGSPEDNRSHGEQILRAILDTASTSEPRQ